MGSGDRASVTASLWKPGGPLLLHPMQNNEYHTKTALFKPQHCFGQLTKETEANDAGRKGKCWGRVEKRNGVVVCRE